MLVCTRWTGRSMKASRRDAHINQKSPNASILGMIKEEEKYKVEGEGEERLDSPEYKAESRTSSRVWVTSAHSIVTRAEGRAPFVVFFWRPDRAASVEIEE